MKTHLLFLALEIGQILPLHVEEGCEAKSEWNVNYKWNEFQISFWAPRETTSSLLSIEVEFVGEIHPVTYDNIEIIQNQILLSRIREGEKTEESFTMLNISNESWVNFVFSLDTHYNFKTLQNETLLPPNVLVDRTPSKMTIKGSNVTVNCLTDSRMWKISDDSVVIPLQEAEYHRITFYSYDEYLPVISLEKREFSFGWNNGTLTTIPSLAGPLPPFLQHQLLISCTQDGDIICFVKIGPDAKVAETLRFADYPKSITVTKKQGSSFFVLQHKNESVTSQNFKKLQETNEMNSETKRAIALGIGIPCIIMVFGLAAVFIYRKRNSSLNDKNSAENDCKQIDVESSPRQETPKSGDNNSDGSGESLLTTRNDSV